MKSRNFQRFAIGAAALIVAASVYAQDPAAGRESKATMTTPSVVSSMSVPQFWGAPAGLSSNLAGMSSGNSIKPKVELPLRAFIPTTACRLVDTRGLFSPVYAGGAFAAGETRVYRAAGNCGLPAGADRIRAVALAVTTPPTAASGDIEVISEAGTLGNTVVMVIQAGQWNSATTISGVDADGDFKVQLRGTSGHVVIDIGGYFGEVDSGNTTDYFSVRGNYNSDGGMFYSETTSSIGAAIRGYATPTGADARLAQGDNALDIAVGGVRVRGAGLNTNATAFVHKVNTASTLCPGFPAYSIINNQYTNANPTALLLITPVEYYNGNTGGTGTAFGGQPANAYYAGPGVCAAGGVWTIHRSDTAAHLNGAGYNVLVIQP